MPASFDAAIAALRLAVEGMTRQYVLSRMIENARRRIPFDTDPSVLPMLESLDRVCSLAWSRLARTGRPSFACHI